MTLALFLVIVTLVACAALIPILAKRARIHHAIVVALALATSVLGALGAVPGLGLLLGAVVVAATGPTHGTPWGLLCALVAGGALAGIGGGAAFIGWASGGRVDRIPLRTLMTTLGAIAGSALSFFALSLVDANAPAHFLWSAPVIIVATSVLGFVLPKRGRMIAA